MTPDGRLALLGDRNGAIWVWDLTTHRLLRVLHTHVNDVRGLAANSRRAWSAAEDGTLCEYDLAKLVISRCGKVSPGFIVTTEFSDDGSRAGILVRADKFLSRRARLLVIDLATWRVLVSRDVPEDEIATAIAFDSKTSSIATASDKHVFVWRGDSVPPLVIPVDGTAVAFTQRGLVVARKSFALELYRTDTGALLESIPLDRWGANVQYSDDALEGALSRVMGTIVTQLQPTDRNSVLVEVGGAQAALVSFDQHQQSGLAPVIHTTHGAVDGIAYARGARIAVAASSRGHELATFTLSPVREVDRFHFAGGQVTSATITDREIVIGGLTSVMRIVPATGAVSVRKLPGRVTTVSSDGRFATLSSHDPDELALWSLADRGPSKLRTLWGFDPYFACRLSRPGCKLVMGDDKEPGEVTRQFRQSMVDAATGTERHTFPSKDLSTMAVSEDGRRLMRVPRDHVEQGSFEHIDAYSVELVNTTNGDVIGTVRTKDEPTALALSRDGAFVAIAEGDVFGKGDWPTSKQRLHVLASATGKEILTSAIDAEGIGAMAFTPDASQLLVGGATCHEGATDGECHVSLIDVSRGSVRRLGGHHDRVTSVSVSPDGRYGVTVSWDGTARIWRLDTGASVSVAVVDENWIVYSDDGVFDASRHGGALVAAVRGDRAFSLDQFAAVNNRPDVLMDAMGFGRQDIVAYFRFRHEARLQRLGLRLQDPTMLFDAGPEVAIQRIVRDGHRVAIDAVVTSSTSDLKSYQIWVNQVPVLRGSGKPLTGRRAEIHETIELSSGDNRIEVGALSSSGVESLRDSRVERVETDRPGSVYFVALGVSAYRDRDLRLGYAAKDAVDLTALFAHGTGRSHVALVDEQVTTAALSEVKAFLESATVNDTVVVFVAGHGMLAPDSSADFLFLPFDFDSARPAETAIPFSAIENLFVDLPARRRLLLIDSCVSGERDEGTISAIVNDGQAKGMRARLARSIGLRPSTPTVNVRLPREFVLDRDRLIFNDVARRAGVVAIGSSRWNEASYENDSWGNGAFTAELMHALTDATTDQDHDGQVSLDELIRAVGTGVSGRTQDLQHPTVREDNLDAAITLPVLRSP